MRPGLVIKTILFDLGNVIIPFDFKPAYERMGALCSITVDEVRARIRATCQKAIRKGGTVRDLNAQVRRDGLYLPCSISVRAITEPKEAERLLRRDPGEVGQGSFTERTP